MAKKIQDFTTKIFYDSYENAKTEAKNYESEARIRRNIHYILKSVIGFAGLVIGFGVDAPLAKIIGFCISAAILIDEISSNHKRFLIIQAATNFYLGLLEQIEHSYNQDLAKNVLPLRDAGDHDAAKKAFEEHNLKFREMIFENTRKYKETLRTADLKFMAATPVNSGSGNS